MKQYTANHIKNIALCGHSNSGKTSLAEALLFKTGVTDRLGKIAEGNTVLDYDAEEIKRKVSVSSALACFETPENKVNLIDTPGLFDFESGVYEGIKAAETVLICVSGKSGVAVGTVKAYRNAVKYGKSKMFYVSKMDAEQADFYKVLEGLKAEFGPSVCPVVVPYAPEGPVECYIDVIDMKAYAYDEKGERKEVPVPDYGHRLDGLVSAISEAVAETDDTLFEKYFSGEAYTLEELHTGLHTGVKNGTITPVICGASTTLAGIDQVIEAIDILLPSAADAPAETAVTEGDDLVEITCDEAGPAVAYVFKTIADPFVGKMSFFKVLSGKLTSDMAPNNSRTGAPEKMSKLLFLRGKKQEEAKVVPAGDIGAATKLAVTNTGDTLYVGKKVAVEGIEYPKPCMSMAIKPKAKGDESKISQGIQRLMEEDKSLSFVIDPETHEQILSGLGEQHLDVTISKLKSKFGVEVELTQPKIAYRETIRKTVKVEGKHKKQTGGHGQFGHVVMEFSPCEGEDLVFEEKVFGGSVPKGFFPAVEKGLREAIKKGVLAGYPVVGLKATLLDGSYHPVDSSEMAFKLAAQLAYKAGLPNASPVLLEPIGLLKAYVPDSNTGDMIGELNKRRGRVLGMNPAEDGLQEVQAEVPMAEMSDFTTLIRSMTQGRGRFELTFQRYEQLPGNLEQKVIEEAKVEAEK